MTIFAIEKINVTLRHFNPNKHAYKLFQTNYIFKGSLSKKLFVRRRLFKEMYSHLFNYRINGHLL